MDKPNQLNRRIRLFAVATVLGAIVAVAAVREQPIAMPIDQANPAPGQVGADGTGSSEPAWNSPANPHYPRLPALIVPPRGGDLVATRH
jgi:hypothetical protein